MRKEQSVDEEFGERCCHQGWTVVMWRLACAWFIRSNWGQRWPHTMSEKLGQAAQPQLCVIWCQ